MTKTRPTCPMSQREVVDLYFLEHRAKLIDIAAFLDRIDRATPTGGTDFRTAALRQAISILTDGQPDRARRVLHLFSDHSDALPDSTEGMKGAVGAAKAEKQ